MTNQRPGAEDPATGDYIVVKALENGVNLIGMTRGRDTRLLHTEKMDAGEVIIAQFTENTSAMKIRGRAKVYTKHGCVLSGQDEAISPEACGESKEKRSEPR